MSAILAAWTSRKLWATIICISVAFGIWERAVNHLYVIPDSKVETFRDITLFTLGTVATMLLFYLGVTKQSADAPSALGNLFRGLLGKSNQ